MKTNMKCRLCSYPLDRSKLIELDVPAGTQLFSDDAATALSLKSTIAVLECSKCSLIQSTGEPVAYENVLSSSSFVSDQLTEHRLGQLATLLSMCPEVGRLGRILEIGCGDGHLLDRSRSMFADSVGIEPTRRNSEAAVDRGLIVHQMLMSCNASVAGAPFDYFCSFHVLEHVTDVCSVLQGIYNNLNVGAVGVIEVPSTEAAIANQRFGDFMPDHLNYFTEATLRLALEWNGFSVENIYRNWGGEHLVAYVKKRSQDSHSLAYIDKRRKLLDEFVIDINRVDLPLTLWGISHHLMPYMPILVSVNQLIAVDSSPSKIGRFIPSTDVRVEPISRLSDLSRSLVAITAPRFRDEIKVELGKKFQSVVLNMAMTEKLGFEVFECSVKAVH